MANILKFDAEKVKCWYARNDIFLMITSFNNFKYYSFMSYNPDGTSNPPRRFVTIIGKRRDCYNFYLKFCGVLKQPTNIFRDVSNWKTSRPYFSLKKEEYKKQREDFFGKVGEYKYRQHIYSNDFIMDIDANNYYEAYPCALKVFNLLKKFNVKFSIYCSGKKGFQILIPSDKCPVKEYFYDDEKKEHNNHECLAFNIAQYIDDKEGNICQSVYFDLHFVKQFYGLDARTYCPIIPLYENEFMDFIKYKDKDNPLVSYDYWMKEKDFTTRGLVWQGTENMNELDKFLDLWIEKKLGGKK